MEVAQAEIQILKKRLAEAEKKLQDQQLLFDNILESTLAGYWDWYIQEEYEFMSPTFKAMFGYQDHEVPNHPSWWQQNIHPDDLPKVFDLFNKHVKSKGKVPYLNEVRYFHKDGSIIWVFCRGKIIEWDSEGNPKRMVGCHVNITPLKNAMYQIAEQKSELQDTNKELKQFNYIVSHDLQEPLNTIDSFVELLRSSNETQSANAKQYLEFISKSVSRMKRITKDLLDYSRIGKSKSLISINCNTLLEAVIDDLQSKIDQTNALIEVEHLPTIVGYETDLCLLFLNLIGNAIKFKKAGEAPYVHIYAKKHRTYWQFAIKDNGIGIAVEHQERVFKIFQRLHTRTAYEGTGIGLAHCMKIVELHKGQIWVESAQDEGSTFYFTIPLTKTEKR